MKRELIALVAHEVNRAYCASLGDTTQPAWADTPDWQKASALAGVDMHLANPDATPEQSHESWLAQKTAEGWAYGEAKDAAAKLHPCFLPYAELPEAQKVKDYLFRGVVHTLKALPDTQSAPIDSAYTAIKYVGRRPEHVDAAYGTRISWKQGETKLVPVAAASKMLSHADVYQLGTMEDGAAPVDLIKKTGDTTEEDRAQDVRQSISIMDKTALASFVKTNFRIDMDKRQAVAAMRAQATQLVDQFGIE